MVFHSRITILTAHRNDRRDIIKRILIYKSSLLRKRRRTSVNFFLNRDAGLVFCEGKEFCRLLTIIMFEFFRCLWLDFRNGLHVIKNMKPIMPEGPVFFIQYFLCFLYFALKFTKCVFEVRIGSIRLQRRLGSSCWRFTLIIAVISKISIVLHVCHPEMRTDRTGEGIANELWVKDSSGIAERTFKDIHPLVESWFSEVIHCFYANTI